MKIFYFLQQFIQKINMTVVKTTCLSNNLLMHIRENTDFPRQKPQQFQELKPILKAVCKQTISVFNSVLKSII